MVGAVELAERERALLESWARGRERFAWDGMVSPESFSTSSPRILFVLKEVNWTGTPSHIDLRDFLRSGGAGKTWNNVARWVKALSALPRELPWDELRDVGSSDRRALLKRIAVMNLKKSPGGSSSSESALAAAVERDAGLLREQFLLYDADLVICGGASVWHLFKAQVAPPGSSRERWTSRGVPFIEYAAGKYAIRHYHPQAHGIGANLLTYFLVDAVREIRA